MEIVSLIAVGVAGWVVGYVIGRRSRPDTPRLMSALCVALAGGMVFASPQEALAICLADVRALEPKILALADVRVLDPKVATYTRYLDLTHFPPAERDQWVKVLSFHLNSLSRETLVVRPRLVAGGSVLAINLLDYGIDFTTYDRLEHSDPYYHGRIEVKSPKGVVERMPTFEVPWLDRAAINELVTRTYSRAPLLRGDWFFFYTSAQAARSPGYYDFLGLGKKEADFQRLIGANDKEAKRLKLETAAAVAKSDVALNNRQILRVPSLSGGYWLTVDFKTNVDRQNTLRLLEGETEPPKGDANEEYGVLPNGLFAYWLQNGQGVRQDTAPDDIASDKTAPGTDRRVHAYVSCVRCHVEGLRPIDDFVRRIYRDHIPFRSPSNDKWLEFRRKYFTDLDLHLTRDRGVFKDAVKACNGLTVAANARAVGAAWEWYAEAAVTPAMASLEVACDEAKLLGALRVQADADKINDPVLAGFLAAPPISMRREHYEEVFPLLQKLAGHVR